MREDLSRTSETLREASVNLTLTRESRGQHEGRRAELRMALQRRGEEEERRRARARERERGASEAAERAELAARQAQSEMRQVKH